MRMTPRQASGTLPVCKEEGKGIWTTTLTTTAIHIYYGCCDTAIALATIGLQEALDYVRRHPARA